MRSRNLLPLSIGLIVFYMFFLTGIQLGRLDVLLSRRAQSRDLLNQEFKLLRCKYSGGTSCQTTVAGDYSIDRVVAALQDTTTSTEPTATVKTCRADENRDCTETKKIVFIKTHKTGSTTLASIIERFGYTRNLSFVVPPNRKFGPHILSSTQMFQRKMLKNSPPPLNGGKYYDMLTNHVRYNRREMNAVIPNATYLTIIRHPVKHFESSFAYFVWDRIVTKLEGDIDDPIGAFMENPNKFLKEKFYFWWQAHNGQLFDLGIQPSRVDDEAVVDAKIRALNEEMDMVLISDYFDESLLVMKRQLCWTMDDILYIPNAIRSQQFRRYVSKESEEEILDWNKSDFKLYQHFNRTLWRKIREYGPCFDEDLKIFRERRQQVMEQCIAKGKFDRKDPRETRYVLKPKASELCKNLWRGDVTFTKLLRNKQLNGRILHIPKEQ
ncbi:galactose-3-O-sulfotransferase 2-like [Ptychodera flava]|uniref:galactose-3-O-sulfotransferase 2-like n=1 Tax=Ptychodera flava TaxID=63121 RepID=UPI003969CCA2